MRLSLFVVLSFWASFSSADEVAIRFHEKATITIETPDGVVSATAIGSREIFAEPNNRQTGILVGSGLPTRAEYPPVIFELRPGRFLICANCTGIAMKTFGLNEPRLFEDIRAAVDAAPRDEPRSYHPDFRPFFIMMAAPPDFSLVRYPDRDDVARYFGPGFTIKSYTVAITDAPVTDVSIVTAIPWICNQIDVLRADRTEPNILEGNPRQRELRALERLVGGECA